MRFTFRNICAKLHLWLGLLSGIVVFIVCFTGALYVFKDEITATLEPWRFVVPRKVPVLSPSRIIPVANNAVGNNSPTAIAYGEDYDAVSVDYFYSDRSMKTVFIDPYEGTVIKKVVRQADDFDFFRFLLDGHRRLWLPWNIGRPVVNYCVLIFFITLLTGLVLWWPCKWTRKTVVSRFTMKPPFKGFRLNFDLHNVMGFYALLPLVVLCFTGLIFGLSWFSRAVYSVSSGGKPLQEYRLPQSDMLQMTEATENNLDSLYYFVKKKDPAAVNFYFALPSTPVGIYRVSVVHERGSYYRTDNLFFDRYTLQPLQGTGPYAGKYTEVSAADRFRRMTLDIHNGHIGGIPGKILMCFVSFVGASLPITGFVIWVKKRHRKK